MNPTIYQRDKAVKLFTPLAYDAQDKLFLLADHSVGFGFDCRPLTDNDSTIADRISVLLNLEFPTGTFVQFSLWSSPDLEEHLARVRISRLLAGPASTQVATQAREDFLRKGTQEPIEVESGAQIRDVHLFVTVKLPIEAALPNEKEQERYRDLQITVERGFKTAKLYPTVLNADRLVRVMSCMLNWGDTAAWRDLVVPECDTSHVIRDQFLDLDNAIEVDATGLTLKGKRVKILSVKRYPDAAHFGQAINYLGEVLSGNRGIRGNCLIVTTLHYPDKETTKANLERQRQWLIQQSATPIARYLPRIGERKAGFDTLFEAFNNGDSPLQVYTSLVLFADTPAQATAMVADTRTYWRELGIQLLEDKFFCLPLFLNSLPFGPDRDAVRDLNRYRTMATRNAIPLLPLFSDWHGTGTPILQLVSRNGQFMPVSLFDSGSNYNCIIAAQSGSGKSFLTNEIITSYLAVGGRCWAIDVGRSYEKLCRQKDGDFMSFGKDSGICLNPFELVADYADEEDILVGLLQAMAAPTEIMSDFQTSGLKRVLKAQWDEHGTTLLVDHIAAAMAKEDDQRLRDIGIQLYAFTSEGQYGRFFNGPNTITFDNPFSVLELEELKGRKHLQKVVLLQLIYQIQQEMYHGQRDRPKVVIIDEAWDLLSEGDTAKFMETGFRRFRKYGGAAVVITQSPGDLYNNPTGVAMAENAANMYLLGQKADTINALEKEQRLPLSAGGYTLLKTVHTVPGAYSEIFLITEYGVGIGRLYVDPFHQLLYSTKAEDVTAIETLRGQGLSTEEAIHRLLTASDHSQVEEPKEGESQAVPRDAPRDSLPEVVRASSDRWNLPTIHDPVAVRLWVTDLPLDDVTVVGPQLLGLLTELATVEGLAPLTHDTVTRSLAAPTRTIVSRIRIKLTSDAGSNVAFARLGSRLASLLATSYGQVADGFAASPNPINRRRGVQARREQLRYLGLALLATALVYLPAGKGLWSAANQVLGSSKQRRREWVKIKEQFAFVLVFAVIDTRRLSPANIDRAYDALERLSYRDVKFRQVADDTGFFTGKGDAPPGVGTAPAGASLFDVAAVVKALATTNLDKRLQQILATRLTQTEVPKTDRQAWESDALPVTAIVGIHGICAGLQKADTASERSAPRPPSGSSSSRSQAPRQIQVTLRNLSDGGCGIHCKGGVDTLKVGEAITLPVGQSGHRLGVVAWLERRGDDAAFAGIEWLLDVPHPVRMGDPAHPRLAVAGMYRLEDDRYALVCDAQEFGVDEHCVITDGESRRWAHVTVVRNTGRVKALLIDWQLDAPVDGQHDFDTVWSGLSLRKPPALEKNA